MVKRLILILAVLLLSGFSTQVFAQEYVEERDDWHSFSIYGGYGFASLPNISSALLEVIAFSYTEPVGGGKTIKQTNQFGPIFAGGDYYFIENVSLGGIFVYESLTRRWDYDVSADYTDWNWSFATLMARFNLQWGGDYVKVYHSLMLGASRTKIELKDSKGERESTSKIIPAAHIVLLGIKIGSEFSVFADFGAGYLGVVNFGACISY